MNRVSRCRLSSSLGRRSTRGQFGAFGRRGYASEHAHGGHAPKKSGGDLPWLIASVTVTVTGCAYLLQAEKSRRHDHSDGHGHGHGGPDDQQGKEPVAEATEEVRDVASSANGTEGGAPEEGEPVAESSSDDAQRSEDRDDKDGTDQGATGDDARGQGADTKGEPSASESSEASEGDSSSGDSKPESSESSEEGDAEGKDDAGAGDSRPSSPTDPGERAEAGLPRATAPKTGPPADVSVEHLGKGDDSGPRRKKVSSGIPVSGGQQESVSHGDEKSPTDKARPVGDTPPGFGNQSTKQEGLSNADTKFAWDARQDETISKKKGEDTVESAKVKGTVDPFRKQG